MERRGRASFWKRSQRAAVCCGKTSIDFIRQQFPPLDKDSISPPRLSPGLAANCPTSLRACSGKFRGATGGIHGRRHLRSRRRRLVVFAGRDIGRHNARRQSGSVTPFSPARLPLQKPRPYWSAGRCSLEIVQKKRWAAGIPIIASVSAPSTLGR